jgi:hypothetical protein
MELVATYSRSEASARCARRLIAVFALILLVASASPTSAFMHQTSKIRFLEYSPAAFDRARQGKPAELSSRWTLSY